jgi:ribosomal protein S18 acetylase RimI-like enzyme
VKTRPASAADLRFVHRDKEIPARAMRRMIREGDVFVAEAMDRKGKSEVRSSKSEVGLGGPCRTARSSAFGVRRSTFHRVGLARLEYLWGKTPFLTSLWVEPRFRRHGVAFALFKHIAALLAGRGEAYLYSSTIPENKAGLAWHRALRFERIGYIHKINPDGGGEVFYRIALRGARTKRR